MLHCYKGDNFINIEGGYNYWGNSCGDIFNPFTKDFIEPEELPTELKVAGKNLWGEHYSARCYLSEFNGKYGIALENEYNDDWLGATDIVNNHEDIIEFARKKPEEYAKRYPQYEVIFGEDSLVWRAPNRITGCDILVAIFIPWNATEEEVVNVAEDLYNTGYVN